MAQKGALESAAKILNEMGFEKNSKMSTKAAFVKNLIKQAYGVDVKLPEIYQAALKELETKPGEQLEFSFETNPKAG